MEEDKKLSGNLTETVLMDKNENVTINNKQNRTEEDFNGNVTEIVVHKCIFEVRGSLVGLKCNYFYLYINTFIVTVKAYHRGYFLFRFFCMAFCNYCILV